MAKYSRIFAYVQGLRPPPGNAGAGARMALLALQATQPAGAHAVDEQQQQVIDDLLVSTNANLALCYHKLGQPQQVIKFASKVLHTHSHAHHTLILPLSDAAAAAPSAAVLMPAAVRRWS